MHNNIPIFEYCKTFSKYDYRLKCIQAYCDKKPNRIWPLISFTSIQNNRVVAKLEHCLPPKTRNHPSLSPIESSLTFSWGNSARSSALIWCGVCSSDRRNREYTVGASTPNDSRRDTSQSEITLTARSETNCGYFITCQRAITY